jgi:hypothetical protein
VVCGSEKALLGLHGHGLCGGLYLLRGLRKLSRALQALLLLLLLLLLLNGLAIQIVSHLLRAATLGYLIELGKLLTMALGRLLTVLLLLLLCLLRLRV